MNIPEQFEDKYEVSNDDHILKRGEPLLYKNSRGIWKLDKVDSFQGNPVRAIHSTYKNEYICVVERKAPLTPEEKINRIKKQARNFVDKYITNPDKNTYDKFELAFLKGDNTGL